MKTMSKKPKKIVIATEDEVAQYADKEPGKEETAPSQASASEAESVDTGEVGGAAAGGATEELSEAEQWKEKCLRAKAELANYQRRMGKDHAESLRYANASLVRALLPILDDLERVVASGQNHQDSAQAVLDGANYIGVGPTFPSGTKTFERFPGVDLLRDVAAEIRLPAFAIGGIDRQNVAQVLVAGFTRIAVSGAVTAADDPGQAAKELQCSVRATHQDPS